MSRIIKTISLNEEADKIASQKPNFSAWVREQLIKEDESFQNSHVTLSVFRDKGICNPSASPRCNICFPHGRPILADIREYNLGLITGTELQSITKKKSALANGVEILRTQKLEPGLEKPGILDKSKKERKYLRRTLRYIWSFI